MLDKTTLQESILTIKQKRKFLEDLAEQPNLGILSLDVSQALAELDDLIEDFENTFPDA
ncbi:MULTISPECIES: hypothetical protein [Synechocystis]|uniref:Uncharacterized protein n=1 Tax=Synechocystis salina LEGE 00031 TaxID=1828736 RepID=A0ABR9VVG4_9SYNC|nr:MULTISPECIES: hypothetical protein [Synechocystis]MBD2655333.1 hypothetical protein [Synechocystis sp. FACHB-383]MBE9195666.1 hypothetical protein [Synechocystis sp. LEGE 06083]MBE9242160.1 hypothetical protein [Synechocystis salina LEGE 00041]MBE9255344.1 hypothetical protein [Synechocystis salina LEGE 00031]